MGTGEGGHEPSDRRPPPPPSPPLPPGSPPPTSSWNPAVVVIIVLAVGVLLLFVVAGVAALLAFRVTSEVNQPEVAVAEPSEVIVPPLPPGAGDDCAPYGGEPARDLGGLYCVGPDAISLRTALESSTQEEAPIGPQVHLVFHEGSEGIDRFNSLAAECFAVTELCPTGRVAFVHGDTVLAAPQIQAPEFERDQIVIGSGGDAVGDLSAGQFQSLVSESLLHPVLATLPIEE